MWLRPFVVYFNNKDDDDDDDADRGNKWLR